MVLLALAVRGQEPVKCGTQALLDARATGHVSPKLRRFVQAPELPDSLVSPSGMFRIHYATSGKDSTTKEYAEYVAEQADAAYRFECDTLGYPKPPYTFADSMWHIYIQDLLSSIYGATPTVGAPVGTSLSGQSM